MPDITLLFLLLLATAVGLQGWLAIRQIRYVRAHRDAVPAAFAAHIPLHAHQRAASYTIARERLGLLALAVDTLLLLGWTLGGGIDALDRFWGGFGHGEVLTGTLVLLSAFAISALLELPLRLVRQFGIERHFGFNRMTPGLFISDLLKGALLALLLGGPLLALVLWLMTHGGNEWWLWVWLSWSGFQLLLLWLFPTVIAPLFNKFTPLNDEALRERIDALLQRCGFTSDGVFVMDGSRRSGHGNAYFTGFGRAKRIVFFDTLLAALDARQIEAVLAHELGHFHHHHIRTRLALSLVLSAAALALADWLLAQPVFFTALGVTMPSVHAGLFLFLAVSGSLSILLHPLSAHASRRHEFEADAYAAQVSDAQALIDALVRLYRDNAATLTPDPLHSAVYDSHPPAAVRVAALERLLASGAH